MNKYSFTGDWSQLIKYSVTGDWSQSKREPCKALHNTSLVLHRSRILCSVLQSVMPWFGIYILWTDRNSLCVPLVIYIITSCTQNGTIAEIITLTVQRRMCIGAVWSWQSSLATRSMVFARINLKIFTCTGEKRGPWSKLRFAVCMFSKLLFLNIFFFI